jgi:hypothetical protein
MAAAAHRDGRQVVKPDAVVCMRWRHHPHTQQATFHATKCPYIPTAQLLQRPSSLVARGLAGWTIQELTRTHTHTLNTTLKAHLCACGSIRHVDRCTCCHLDIARHTFNSLPGSRCTGCCRRLREAGKLACVDQPAGHLLLQPSSDMLAWPSLLQHLGGNGLHGSSGTR